MDSNQRSMGIYAICPLAHTNTERQSFVTSLRRSVCETEGFATSTRFDYLLISLATGRIYAVWEDRMSESPASMMAMVEQRKSLPQAVPSSICITEKFKSANLDPPKTLVCRELLLRAPEYQCPPEPASKLLRKTCDFFFFLFLLNRVWNVRCCR